jgi:hypothetical protein
MVVAKLIKGARMQNERACCGKQCMNCHKLKERQGEVFKHCR